MEGEGNVSIRLWQTLQKKILVLVMDCISMVVNKLKVFAEVALHFAGKCNAYCQTFPGKIIEA